MPLKTSLNESTDSFLLESPSLQSIRNQNPNLQSIDEDAIKRKVSIQHKKKDLVRAQHRGKDSFHSRYLMSPTLDQNKAQFANLSSSVTTDTDKLSQYMLGQNFWKYHVISIGRNQMYLTTNPDIKHLYCRPGLGYFVQLVLPKTDPNAKMKQSELGFRLIFKRQNYDELDNEENLKEPKECIVVTKDSKQDGGSFHIVLSLMNDLNGTDKPNPQILKNVAHEVPIVELSKLLQKDPNNHELMRLVPTFHRYEMEISGKNWLVGSNPIPKQKRLNKLGINNDIFKLTGKQNVYFYEGSSKNSELTVKSSKRLSFIGSLRKSSHHSQAPSKDELVLALFRPHEKRFKKKVLKTLGTSSGSSNVTSDADQFNYIESDKPFYYRPGDGLLQPNPLDDSPNDTKIGWLTIYDHESSLELWELVVGYTFAVGFERVIDEYLLEQTV